MEIIDYEFKEKNKFPHVVYIKTRNDDSIFGVLKKWLNENCGKYKTEWFCAKFRYDDNDDEFINDDLIDWPYAFKTLESAMAFKLRWS